MSSRTSRLTLASLLLSSGLTVALGAAAYLFQSTLALAQAADSLMDVAGALVLFWAVRIAHTPRDAGHPLGHSRAEPLGALFIAALAAMLSIEVGTDAIRSLMGAPALRPTYYLIGLFGIKVLAKAIIWFFSSGGGPALSALHMDARNDVLVGSVAVLGFFLARAGYPAVDPWLSLPIAAWIGYAGFELARENVGHLMGAAPPIERQRELLAIAASVSGVLDAHDLSAQFLGAEISLHIHVTVAGDLSLREGHDLGEAVRLRLLEEPDVYHCTVHVDPAGSVRELESTGTLG